MADLKGMAKGVLDSWGNAYKSAGKKLIDASGFGPEPVHFSPSGQKLGGPPGPRPTLGPDVNDVTLLRGQEAEEHEAAKSAPVQPAEDGSLQSRPSSMVSRAPVLISPAGWEHASRQTKLGYTDAETAPIVAAEERRYTNMEEQAKLAEAMGARQAARDASYQAQYAKASQTYNDQFQAIQNGKQRYVEGKTQHLESLAAQTQARADPDQFWKERGTGAQVAAAIFMGLGQYAAIMTKTDNAAMRVIDQAIDRNIRAQQANIENSRAAFDTEANLYQMNLDAFGNREQAIKATRVNYLDQVGSMLDAKLADENLSDAQKAQALKFKQQILDDRANTVKGLVNMWHDETAQTDVWRQAQYAQPASTAGETGKEGNYVPSLRGFATSENDAKLLKEHASRTVVLNSTLKQAQDIIKEAKALGNMPGDLWKKKELQSKLDALSNSASFKETVKEGQGAMSKGDKEVADAALGIVGTNLFTTTNKGLDQVSSVISSTRQRAVQEHTQLGDMYGVMPGRLEFRDVPGKGKVPVRVLDGKLRASAGRRETQNFDDMLSDIPAGK